MLDYWSISYSCPINGLEIIRFSPALGQYYYLNTTRDNAFFHHTSAWWTSKSSIEHDRTFLSGVSALRNPILDITVMTLGGNPYTLCASLDLNYSYVVIN